MFQWGVEEWLESFILEGKEKNPNTDWLRLFHVSDAYPESNFDTFIVPVNVLKKDGKGWQLKKESHDKQTTIWVECIPEDISFRFQLSWDKKLFNDFKTQNSRINLPKNIDELLVIINNWIIDVVKEEKRFLSNHSMAKWIENKKINFRIGFGSGMMSTTIFPLLSEELRKKIRNYAGLNRGNDEAPKSRRVWIKDGSYIPLGWAVMEVLPFDAKKGLFSRPVENAQKIESPEKQETKEIENQTEKQKEIKQPEQILIQNAILVYSPGDRSLSTTVEGKKAFVDHIEDDFVPEHLWPKLKKDKNIKASIVIEPLGNAYKIIKIEG